MNRNQWRIQDFPEMGDNPKEASSYYWANFLTMKIKKLDAPPMQI